MDAIVRLALMSKAKTVFESDGTFLSFPALNPLTYSTEWLHLALADGGTDAELKAASEFSRVVNAIPGGPLFDGPSEELLWDVYGDVLHRAHIAGGSLTAAEQSARDRAQAALYVSAADGSRSDSPQLRAYKQYRDAVITAQEELRNAEATARAAGDEAFAAWQSGAGATLRQALVSLQQEWVTKGWKDLIEQALNVEETLGQKAARGQWTEWQNAFNPDIDLQTDLDRQRFAVTGLVPSDALDLDSWPTFTLSAEEITALAAGAPPELRNLLDSTSGATDILSLTFEYRSVALNRPWFNPRVFRARCWKFDDDEPPLSDGATPPNGRCPAYVVALVLARNIDVSRRQPSGGVEHVNLGSLQAIEFSQLRLAEREKLLARGPAGGVRVVESDGSRAFIRPAPAASPASSPMIARRFVATGAAAAPALAAAPATPLMMTMRSSDVRRAAFTRLTAGEFRVAADATIPPPTSQPTPPPSDPATRDRISVLAMICRGLPKCPDPDPTLNWD